MLGGGLSGYISSILCMFVEDWGWIGVGLGLDWGGRQIFRI